MPTRALLSRYRFVALGLLASALLHAAVLVGIPKRVAMIDDRAAPTYSATLEPLPPPPAFPIATPAAIAPARPTLRARTRVAAPRMAAALPSIEPLAQLETETLSDIAPLSDPQPMLDRLAMAAPVAPPAPDPFPVEAMPAQISIEYTLTSAFADGRAAYRWRRDGDNYQITGEAAAEGVFALFLEGRIVQQSNGTVTASGLRPDRFTERKPGSAPEGVEFDWAGKRAILERNGTQRTEPLQDNTVDWLSMIFQLAHRPPSGAGMDIQVFTQRKLEAYHLLVVGPEDIEVPLGKVRTLHLRHVDPKDASQVDVWLGVEQHYLPVKLRFPVAKNRLTVEQVATRISER